MGREASLGPVAGPVPGYQWELRCAITCLRADILPDHKESLPCQTD